MKLLERLGRIFLKTDEEMLAELKDSIRWVNANTKYRVLWTTRTE